MKHPIRNSFIGLISALLIVSISVCSYVIFFSNIEQRAEFIAEKISDKLELTSVQNEKLVNLKIHIIALIRTIKKEQQYHHQEILALIANEQLNRANANKLFRDKTHKLSIEASPLIDLIADFYDSLDAQQQQTIRNKIIQQSEKHNKHSFAVLTH